MKTGEYAEKKPLLDALCDVCDDDVIQSDTVFATVLHDEIIFVIYATFLVIFTACFQNAVVNARALRK